jgi:hypothetical protein
MIAPPFSALPALRCPTRLLALRAVLVRSAATAGRRRLVVLPPTVSSGAGIFQGSVSCPLVLRLLGVSADARPRCAREGGEAEAASDIRPGHPVAENAESQHPDWRRAWAVARIVRGDDDGGESPASRERAVLSPTAGRVAEGTAPVAEEARPRAEDARPYPRADPGKTGSRPGERPAAIDR